MFRVISFVIKKRYFNAHSIQTKGTHCSLAGTPLIIRCTESCCNYNGWEALNKDLDQLLFLEHNETDWTYITVSCNPYGRDCSEDENKDYYESLLQHVFLVLSYKYFEGEGQRKSGV